MISPPPSKTVGLLELAGLVSRGTYQPAAHLKYLAGHLRRLAARKERWLQVQMPPRHGKTLLIGRQFPLWYLLTFPTKEVLYATHTESFASEAGEAVRDLMLEWGPQLAGLTVSKKRRSSGNWAITDLRGRPTGGGMRAVGVGTAIHGRGAHMLLLDDLIGKLEDAISPTHRDRVHRWLTGSAFTRLSPDGVVCNLGTPVHSDDVFARLERAEEAGGDKWTRVRLPAFACQGDALGRKEGAALWPERFPAGELERIRKTFEANGNIRDWSAQYELTPVTGDGVSEWPEDLFTDIWRDTPPESPALRVLALDPSKGKSDKVGDYQALTDMMVAKNYTCYVRSTMKRQTVEATEDYTVEMLRRNRYDAFIIEVNGEQQDIADNIARKYAGRTPIYHIANSVNKIVRIRMDVGGILHNHRLKLLRDGPDNRLLLQQLQVFPNGQHDDGPDSVSMAARMVNDLLTGDHTPGLRLRTSA